MKFPRKKILVTVVVLLLASGAALGWWQSDHKGSDNNNSPDTYKPKAEEGEATLPATSGPIDTPDLQSNSNLAIENLSNGARIETGTVVSGQALSMDGVLHVSIKGSATGKVSDYTVEIARSDSEPQPYSFEIYFERIPQPGENGVLDVYTEQNGLRAYSAQIEVTF